MAYTKIHPIKSTLHKAIKYICDEKKTDNSLLISSFGCSPQCAAEEFKLSLSQANGNGSNLAFHLIQSFAPNEVTYEAAHAIGEELADRLLLGKYSYVVATHIDRGHIHNHIIFCAADNIEHKKYNDNKRSYYQIRKLSDELCQEHGLSVILPGSEKGMKYNEWLANQNGTSLRNQTRKDIDGLIKKVRTYDELLVLMRAKGYNIKGEALSAASPKYISFNPAGTSVWFRGRDKGLGVNYTRERINERIIQHQAFLLQKQSAPPAPRRLNLSKCSLSHRSLIDTSDAKFQESAGLQHWAELENLKIAAANYSNAASLQDMKNQIALKSAAAKEARTAVRDMEHELKRLGELLKYAEQYAAYEPFNRRYRSSKNPDAYYRTHDTQIILYCGAKNVLEQNGVNVKKMDISKMRQDYLALESKKNELVRSYKADEKTVKELQKNIATVEQYLDIQHPDTLSNHSLPTL